MLSYLYSFRLPLKAVYICDSIFFALTTREIGKIGKTENKKTQNHFYFSFNVVHDLTISMLLKMKDRNDSTITVSMHTEVAVSL